MPNFNSYLDKAKAKAEALAKQHNINLPPQIAAQLSTSHQQQQHPPPQGSYQQYPSSSSNHQTYQPPPQGSYQQYPPPPRTNYPGQQNPPPPPPSYQAHPPTPNLQSSYAPPLPGNKPSYTSPHQQQPQPYWRAAFSPNTPVSTDFKHQLGDHGWGNNELQNYIASPENSFYTPDGKLVLRAIARNGQFTSARLTSHSTLNKQRGSLVAIATPPCAEGIWPALWLLPNEPFQWPNEGEFDILETWNGDNVNHTCLHWGHFNGEDWDKHRVMETNLPDMRQRPVRYEFVWEQDEHKGRNDGGGRAIWYIDGRPVMKAPIPAGARRMSDWQIIINVAMGGNVCQGKKPVDGQYDLVIHELKLEEQPSNGWAGFEQDWNRAPDGHP